MHAQETIVEVAMLSRILVVVDGSIAQPVLGWVRRLLSPVGGDVRLLTVLPQVRAVITGGRTVAFTDQREAIVTDGLTPSAWSPLTICSAQ